MLLLTARSGPGIVQAVGPGRPDPKNSRPRRLFARPPRPARTVPACRWGLAAAGPGTDGRTQPGPSSARVLGPALHLDPERPGCGTRISCCATAVAGKGTARRRQGNSEELSAACRAVRAALIAALLDARAAAVGVAS